MCGLCGANCQNCPSKDDCKGCKSTGAMPFGDKCVAGEYIKIGGMDAYLAFKNQLMGEINELLVKEGIPKTDNLFELHGEFVNLQYDLPSGEKVKFLKDNKIYLGCQIEASDCEMCYGVVADTSFILICSYSVNGSLPEIITYKRR